MFEPQEPKETEASRKVNEAARKAAEGVTDPSLRKIILEGLQDGSPRTAERTPDQIKDQGSANFNDWVKQQQELRAKQAAEKKQPSPEQRDELLKKMRDATRMSPERSASGDALRKAADGTSSEAKKGIESQKALIEALQKKRAEEKAASEKNKQ